MRIGIFKVTHEVTLTKRAKAYPWWRRWWIVFRAKRAMNRRIKEILRNNKGANDE